MNTPRLSIVVPVYGTEKYLKRCLDSILTQSYRNLEVIVVDDCSPDNSAKIIEDYCKNDSRVRMVAHEKNKGLFRARVTGAELATGEYIAFVDSDDHVSLDFYRPLISRAEEGSFDIVAGNTVRESDSGALAQFTLHKICFGENALYGNAVRETFFAQEGSCYAWHTVWNKIYRKSLWDKCVCDYQTITKHLIMTEDIAFSSLLFYRAESFVHVDNSSCYYYFANENASTNSEKISFGKFKKNIEDITLVFDFVEGFLTREDASEEIRRHFSNFRAHYYRIWKNLQEQTFVLGAQGTQAKDLIERLGNGQTGAFSGVDFYFDSLVSTAYPQIEEIKKLIASNQSKIISFDVFDTLLIRPLWNPDDVFVLMQEYFETECPKFKNVSFKKLRQTAESQARGELYLVHPGYEDITLDEVYQKFAAISGISIGQADKLKAYEEQLELMLIRPRNTGKELFEFAKASGKRVVLISDMYLGAELIETMLRKCGYSGYERLFLSSQARQIKHSGNLFTFAVADLSIKPDQILHIGDNWECDVVIARNKGFGAAFLPKSKDRFCNALPNVTTNQCASIGCATGGSLTTWDKMFSSIGLRSMMALAANKAFDNPYSSWNPNTDFDANPYFMGYYAVGMHLVGMGKWLAEIVKKRGIRQISFLGRDGYLPLKAMGILKTSLGADELVMNYVPCSRKVLLPWIIETQEGLFALPIEYRNHTPLSLSKMLSCCCCEENEDALAEVLKKASFIPGKKFTAEREYYHYITWFRDHLFDAQKLERFKEVVSAYYQKNIGPGNLVFDLGYSGRILDALQKSLQYPVVYAYVHHDNSDFHTYCRRSNLDVEVMYDFVPQFSDLIREYFLSEVGNCCVGLAHRGDEIVPLFTQTDTPFVKRFAVDRVAEGALRFAQDFVDTFGSLVESMHFDPVQVSMPFEGLIHASKLEDRRVFAASATEDSVFGQDDDINMTNFWTNQINRALVCNGSAMVIADYYSCVRTVAYGKGKLAKALVYAICDRKTLKEKLYVKLQRHPAMLFILRKTYKAARSVRNIFKHH